MLKKISVLGLLICVQFVFPVPVKATYDVGSRLSSINQLKDTIPAELYYEHTTGYFEITSVTDYPYTLTRPDGSNEKIYVVKYEHVPPQPIQLLLILKKNKNSFKIIKKFEDHWFPSYRSFSALGGQYFHVTSRGGQSSVDERFFALTNSDTLFPLKEVNTKNQCLTTLRTKQPDLYHKLREYIYLDEGFLNLWNSGARVQNEVINVDKLIYTEKDANCCPSYHLYAKLKLSWPETIPENYTEKLPVITFSNCHLEPTKGN